MAVSSNTTQVTVKQRVGRGGTAVGVVNNESQILQYAEHFRRPAVTITGWVAAVEGSLRDKFGESSCSVRAEGEQRREAEKIYDKLIGKDEWKSRAVAKIREISPEIQEETAIEFVSVCAEDRKQYWRLCAETWYGDALEKSFGAQGTSIRPKSLLDSAQDSKGVSKEYLRNVKKHARNYKETHVVFLSAITRNEAGMDSTEYHVARQLTKILRARGIPVFWWENPEPTEKQSREFEKWRTIGTKIAMGLAYSSVFIGLSFDSVKFNDDGDGDSFQYTWLSEEEPYRSRYKNFRYEVEWFAKFVQKKGTDVEFTKGITDQRALPTERTMLMFSYGLQNKVKESEFFGGREQVEFENVRYQTGETFEARVNRIVEEILKELYVGLLHSGKRADEDGKDCILAMSQRKWKNDKTPEEFEHWFKTLRDDEKLIVDREGWDDGNYEKYFHNALNTPSDRYFKYAIVDERGEDVAVGDRPPFEMFLERKYDKNKPSYDVCLVVNDWNDVCLYLAEGGQFFDHVYVYDGQRASPRLSEQSAANYPLAKYTSFTVDGSHSSSQKMGRKLVSQEGETAGFRETVGMRQYKDCGGKYYLHTDLDDETVTTLTCTLTFGEKGGKKYFCAFKYAVKKVVHYDVIHKKQKGVTVRLSEKLTEKDLNGANLGICLVSSGPNNTYEPYGRGGSQDSQRLDTDHVCYTFSNPPAGETWKIAFADEDEGRDALVVFLKDYPIKREKKWSSKERPLRCPYCSKPLLKRSKIKKGEYIIDDAGNMKFSEAGKGEVIAVYCDMSDPKGVEKLLGKHYFDANKNDDLHCLECEMKRYKLFRRFALDSSHDPAIVRRLQGDDLGKVRIVKTVLPAPYVRGLTLGYVGDQNSGKSSFIAESMRLSIRDKHIKADNFIEPANATLPLAPHKMFTDPDLLVGGVNRANLVANLQISVIDRQPHVHLGYAKMVYGPNIHATESRDDIQQWLEAHPFLLEFSKNNVKQGAYLSCFDFPGGMTVDMTRLRILNDIDAMILFLDPTTNDYGSVASIIRKARTALNAKGKKNAKRKKDNKLILAVVLCKFDTYDGTGCGGSERNLQFNGNSYVCVTPPPMTETRYESSKLSMFVDRCSLEVEGWLRSQRTAPEMWGLIDSIPKHKFFAVSSLGNRHSITSDPSQIRFMDNARGLEMVYTWLAYQAGIIE